MSSGQKAAAEAEEKEHYEARLHKLKVRAKMPHDMLKHFDEINEATRLLGSGTSQLTRSQWRALDRIEESLKWLMS